MNFEVRIGPRAIEDLTSLYDYIAGEAGFAIADGYLSRIESACARLAYFPHRGTPGDDLVAGLRTLAFERRAVIAYRVSGHTVIVDRVLYCGRDLDRALP